MIELDGEFYQVKADGVAYPVADTMKTPFASVTFFQADKAQAIKEETNFQQLQELIDSMIDNENIFYAVKVTGSFKYVKTRSVPGQQKPYPPLAEVTKNQPTFEFDDVDGTLAGFLCPAYVEGLNVPGYHLHFLNAAKNAGGHLLDFIMASGQVEIDATPNFYMRLPENGDFGKIDMTEDRSQETNIVEK
jgi:acetolactate decarboxylase